MPFNELPLQTQLQLILNDLSNCHVLGVDSLRFGNALQALEQVKENANVHENTMGE